LFPDGEGGFKTLIGMRWRHPDVDDDEVGSVRTYPLHEILCVAGLSHDGEVVALKQACKALAEQDIVVGDDDPHPGRRVTLPVLCHTVHPRFSASINDIEAFARRDGCPISSAPLRAVPAVLTRRIPASGYRQMPARW